MDELQRQAEKGLELASHAERQGRVLRAAGLGLFVAAALAAAAIILTGIADSFFAGALAIAGVAGILGYQLAGAGTARLAAAARARDVARRALAAKSRHAADGDDREPEDSSS